MKKWRRNEIAGHLDIRVHNQEDEFEGNVEKWQDVLIYGDPEGLRSFAKFLIQVADLNQDSIPDKELPFGEREHFHIQPKWDISNSSVQVVVGRLDAKGTGHFYDSYVAKDSKKKIDK
ncbi:MAG: hypothetical protein ACHQHN_06250 [Sphingobacteriales bacterium]